MNTPGDKRPPVEIPPEVIAVLVDFYVTMTKALVEQAKREINDGPTG